MNVFNVDISSNQQLDKILDIATKIAPKVTSELAEYFGVAIQRIWINELYDTPTGRHKGWGIKAGETIKYNVRGSKVKIYADEKEIDPRTGKKKILFVNIIEDGISSWSIKEALLNSSRVRISKHGVKYVRVPFRWRIPNNQQKSAYFAGVMPDEVYNIVKGGKTRLKGIEYGHMAGLARYGTKGHYQYFTFRTVSEKSQGWQYPNIAPTPVYRKVLKQIEQMIPIILENYCKALIDRIVETK